MKFEGGETTFDLALLKKLLKFSYMVMHPTSTTSTSSQQLTPSDMLVFLQT